MFQKLSKIIEKRVKKYSFKGEILAINVCELWEEAVASLIGENVSKKSQAVYFKGGILYVKAFNPVIAQELQLQKRAVIGKINALLKKESVKDIVFKV